MDEVFEDINTYFTEQMRPPQKEKEQIDLMIDFKQLSLFGTDLEKAA